MGRLDRALVLSAKYRFLSEILFPSQNRGLPLSERYLPPVFRCFCFCIHHPGTALLYKLAPRHHRFHTCGLLFIVRHVQQQCVEVLEHIQVVCLCGFYQAVDDGTGSCALKNNKEAFNIYIVMKRTGKEIYSFSCSFHHSYVFGK